MSVFSDVTAAVRAILRAPGDSSELETIRELAAVRSAARRVMEDEFLTPTAKAAALKGVFAAAEATRLPHWAKEAVWAEVDEFLGATPRPTMDTEESASRRLRHASYAACPTCRRPVLSEFECDLRERERRAWDEHAALRDRTARRSE